MKKNPMMESRPTRTYGSTTGRRVTRHGQKDGQPDEPREDPSMQEFLPDLQGQLKTHRTCQPGHVSRLPVTSTNTSSRLASRLWRVSTW